MCFEIPALIGGLIVGALVVYIVLNERTKLKARTQFSNWIITGRVQIEKEADQRAEQKYTQINSATLAAWKATELQRVREEDQKENQRIREENVKEIQRISEENQREIQRIRDEDEKKRRNSLDTSRD